MVDPHLRATLSTEAGCARKLSRSDGDEHEHGPFGLRRGAIVGVGASRRLTAVRWGVTRRIVLAWILTIPGAALLGAILFHAVRSWVS